MKKKNADPNMIGKKVNESELLSMFGLDDGKDPNSKINQNDGFDQKK